MAATRCPRCEAALEPIPVPASQQEIEHVERELVLIGARNGSASTSHIDPMTRSIVDHVSLPPLVGPAGGMRRTALPKLPAPYAPDPLVMAVFLGIPMEAKDAAPEPEPTVVEPTVVEPVATEPAATAPVATEPVAVPPTIALPADAFGLLLGTSPLVPAPQPLPATAAPAIVAVPVAEVTDVNAVATTSTFRPVLQPAKVRRSRFARRDPFTRTTTRRERVLTRLCMTLVLALAGAVLVLRLPLGARPELGATSAEARRVGSAAANSLDPGSPFGEAIRQQTHADLLSVVNTAALVYPVWHTYAAATPAVLGKALPQFGFVTKNQWSTRVGEMSVAGGARQLVLAEYAGPRQCVFARVIVGQGEQIVGPVSATCHAASAPVTGWTPLRPPS